jgi:hypothetical protein
MSGSQSEPPWDFFHDASAASLQSFELSRLNHAANIRREVGALLDQWVNDNSQALLARWVREQRALPSPSQAAQPENILQQSPIPFEPPAAPAVPVLLPLRSQRPHNQARTTRS